MHVNPNGFLNATQNDELIDSFAAFCQAQEIAIDDPARPGFEFVWKWSFIYNQLHYPDGAQDDVNTTTS